MSGPRFLLSCSCYSQSHLRLQNSCWNSGHHIYYLICKKGGAKKAMPLSLLKLNTSLCDHIPLTRTQSHDHTQLQERLDCRAPLLGGPTGAKSAQTQSALAATKASASRGLIQTPSVFPDRAPTSGIWEAWQTPPTVFQELGTHVLSKHQACPWLITYDEFHVIKGNVRI